jgi:hypothetical protein
MKRCDCKCECKPDSISFFWMNDNHTFIRMKGNNLDEIIEHAKQLNNEYPYGMLCPPTLLRNDMDFYRIGKCVHAGEQFSRNTRKWKREIEQDENAMQLIREGKIDHE